MAAAGSVEHAVLPGGFGRGLLRFAVLCVVFAAGSVVGYCVWDAIRLPFHNPLNVVGPLATAKFNPANNMVRFLVFIGLPAALLVATALVPSGSLRRFLFAGPASRRQAVNSTTPRVVRIALFVITVSFAALASLTVPTYHASRAFDTFHEGESLGSAVAIDHGLAPYRDVIFLHGLVQDPYRSHLAFHLFGRSIGAARTLESMVKVASWVLLAAAVVLLFGKDYLLALPALLALILMQREFADAFYRRLIDSTYTCDPAVMLILPPRDITLLLFVLSALALDTIGKRGNASPYAISALGFVLAFVSVGAFGYSVDRGFYLTTAFVCAAPVLQWQHFWHSRSRWIFPMACALGSIAALGLLYWLLQGQIGAFAEFVFRTMPRYKELSDGHEYRIAFPPYLRVALLFSAAVFWTGYQLVRSVYTEGALGKGMRVFVRDYFVEALLLVLAVCYFRSALGRVDWEHIVYSAAPLYLLVLLILGKHLLGPWLGNVRSAGASYSLLGVTVVATLLMSVDMLRSHTLEANFPYRTPDDRYVAEPYRAAASYLNENLGPGETLYTLTSEASWFYLVGRPTPVRFPVLWFAATEDFQRELVRSLESANVKYIVYDSPYPDIDDMTNDTRYPALMDYIREHYHPDREFDGVKIWSRRG